MADDQLLIRWGPIPSTAQEGFFEDDTPNATILFTGGYGSGKTMTLVGKALKLSAINDGLPIIWTVPDFGHVTDTIIPTLTDLDPDTEDPWFLRSDQFWYSQRDHVLHWDGGGPFHFQSAKYPDSIKGPNMAAAVIDEPGILSLEAWRNTVNRVRHPRARLRQKIAAGTPEGLNFLTELFSDEDKANYKVYRMSTRQNTELLKRHPDYIQQIMDNATDAELQSYLEGRMVNLHGALAYATFKREDHFREDVPIDAALPLRIAFDFNVDPMACVICQIGPRAGGGRELRVIDAVIKSASWTPEICHIIVDRYDGWRGGVIVYGDATGAFLSTTSRQSNYDLISGILRPRFPSFEIHESALRRQNPPEEDRVHSMNVLFQQNRCYIRRTNPAKLAPTMPLVWSLERTIKAPGTSKIAKPSGETHTHPSDALGYLVQAEFPVRRPRIFGDQSFARSEM